MVILRDETVRSALLPRASPVGHPGAMHSNDRRYDAGAAEFGDDGLCWLHESKRSDNRYIVKLFCSDYRDRQYVAENATVSK